MFLDIDRNESDRVALKDMHGGCLTYGQFAAEIKALQGFLPKRALGFCMCRNVVGCVVGYASMVDAGFVPVMLDASIDIGLLKKLDDIYRPVMYWMPIDATVGKSTKELFHGLGYRMVSTGYAPYGLHKDLELCMSTSGSTGDPKLVRYKTGNLLSNAKNVASAFEWTENERGFADLGLQYTMGLNVVNSLLYSGASVLLCDCNPLMGQYWDYLQEERATSITGVPFTYDIFSRLHFTEKKLPYLTTIAEGGGKLSDTRFKELADYAAANGKRFFATFGTTETAARIAFLPPDLAQKKTGSIGKAIPEGELFLINNEGSIVQGNPAEGELCYRGPNVTMGYAQRKEDLLLGDEWKGVYRTGDLARRDDDGFYYITGRLSRFVKLLGHRISLDQCERLVSERFETSCACLGDDKQLHIFVESFDNPQEIIRYLGSLLGLRKSLFSIQSIDRLPRSASGKIMYSQLG